MESYEKKYKELIEKIELISHSALTVEQHQIIDTILGELKESEDERIRKSLISYLHGLGEFEYPDKKTYHDWLEWLEKQGEQKPFFEFKAEDWYVSKVDGKIHNMTYNPTDKFKPKFHEGDWVVKKGHSYLIADIDYEQRRYLFEIGGYTHEQLNWEYIENVDNKYHLWTIQDAKDGDVLYCENSGIEYIVMNKGINKCNNIDSYFRYNSEDGFDIGVPSVLSAEEDIITPATKEQRELLFQKMREAGYEWDAEKKELREIEQKPAWSKEDDVRLQACIDALQAKSICGKVDTIMTKWLKSLKQRIRG